MNLRNLNWKRILPLAMMFFFIVAVAIFVLLNIFQMQLSLVLDGYNHKCGKNLEWSIENEDTLVIDGSGVMYPYNENELQAAWLTYENMEKITKVRITRNVSRLDEGCFKLLYNVEQFDVDTDNAAYDEINSILYTTNGETLFAAAPKLSLEVYEVFSDIKTVASYAFSGSNIKQIILPNTVENFNDSAFKNANKLVTLNIPNSITNIGKSVFEGCSNLKNVNISNNITSIGDKAFKDCGSIEHLVLSQSIKEIGESAFDSCSSLETLVLNAKISEIKTSTFQDCYSLKSVKIPSQVTKIGDSAFRACAIENIYISENVDEMGINVFHNCKNLSEITVASGNKNYASVDGVLMSKDMSIIYKYPSAKLDETYIVGEQVKTIKSFAFASCHNLKEITVDENVTNLSDYSFFKCADALYHVKKGSAAYKKLVKDLDYDFEILD